MKQYSICTCIAAACVIFLALSVNSCKKDDGTVSLKIGAANIGENSKHKQKNYIDIDSLILEVGDPVKVNGVVKQIFEGSEGETCLSVSQSADGYACLYPAHAGTFTCSGISNVGSGVVNIPANQSYTLTNNNKNQKLELPMVDYVVDEHQIVKFRNAASVVKVVVFNLNLNPIIVNSVTISGANLCGDLAFDFDNAQKIITPATLSNAGNTVTLSCNATVQAGSNRAFHLMVAPFETAQELTVTLNIGTNEQESQTVTRSLAVGKMGIIDFLLGDDIPACTQALFTVSAEGKKVCFSPGNLQRRGSLISWQLRFAPNQWDAGTKVSYMEDASWNIVPTDENAWYGLFSWGTGDRATSYVSVSSESYVDWGINPIQLGNTSKTYKSGYWRVLNSNEGAFLLSNPVRGEARFVDCMVHGVYGVVIFPDHYDLSHPLLLGRQLNTSNTIGTANFWQITNNEWDIMEKEGCVFLPITGWYSFTGGSSPDLYQEENEGFYFCRTRPSGYYTFGYVDRPTHGTKHGSGSQCAVRMVHNAVGF